METEYINRTWTGDAFGPVQNEQPLHPRKSRVPVLLFLLTIISTVWAGCLHEGIDMVTQPHLFYRGLPFAVTLLTILGVHEAGHYLFCRFHGIPSSVPYFIPMPNFLGTMGAFIRIKGRIETRRALMDIGMSGPLAGFAIALPATIIGYRLSEVIPVIPGEGILLGQSILTWLLEKLLMGTVPEGYMIALHPVGFAGYIGLFVTAMNLLPVGQLDGSHIISALFGSKQASIAKMTVLALFVLGLFWRGWWLWALLLLATGLKHQVIRYDAKPPGTLRTSLAWLTIIIFVLTFVPVPFSFGTFAP